MPLQHSLLAELDHEGSNTRRMLSRVPVEHFTWKPHAKSFTLGRLVTHIAEIPTWVTRIVKEDELNLATLDYKAQVMQNTSELMKLFEENLAKAKEDIKEVPDETFMKHWTLRSNDKVYFTIPKISVMRDIVLNHIVHHRAQLSVYLRLLDIPVPAIYGPTADEQFG